MDAYLWFKSLHVMSIIAWMAGLFYLPRLFIYHTMKEAGSDASETFKVMERKLLKIIMTPAMVSSWLFGLLVAWQASLFTDGWFHVKLLLVIGMTVFHFMLDKWRKDFEADQNQKSEKFYRIANEVPTLLMIIIVILVIVKPF
jgi:putative membrane protein